MIKRMLLVWPLPAILFMVLMLQSCEPTQPGYWKNTDISDNKKFHELNSELLKDLKTNDETQLEYMMSRDFINYTYKKRQIELVSNRVKANDYQLLDEYYVINRYLYGDTIRAGTKSINNYSLTYQGVTHQMYLAFFVPKNKQLNNQDMITAVYCKYDYGWKLSELEVNHYKINGKTAPELHEQAKASYHKGFLIEGLNLSAEAIDCSRPSPLWQYDNEEDISSFYNAMIAESATRYQYPLVIKQISTKPQIIRIFNQTTADGVFPMIYYLTKVKITDIAAVKAENENIQKAIGPTLPGIDQDKKYILYCAFNEAPNGTNVVEHVDMTEKLR